MLKSESRPLCISSSRPTDGIPKNGNQRRQIDLHCVPKDVQVDVIIAMDDSMSHIDDRIPRQVRQEPATLFGHVKCGFADDLDEPHESQAEHVVRFQIGSSFALDKLMGALSGLQHVSHTIMVEESSFSGGILHLRFGHHALAKVPRDVVGGAKIGLSTNQPRQFQLQRGHPQEADSLAWFELNKQVHVAQLAKIVAENGTEDRQARNVMALTELSDHLRIELDTVHYHVHILARASQLEK